MSDSTAAIYTVFTSPHHAPMPNHLPTLIVTPHGQPNQILYTYLHTEENRVNYLLTPSPQGDLCVAKLFPPARHSPGGSANGHGHGKGSSANVVRCEASRDLKWTIENTGVMSPIYKIVNQDDTPLYQISKPNPNAEFWTMFYFKYAGHQIPPKRIEFGRVAKNPPEKGGGTRITITGKSEDEKQVWQTLGVGNEDCVEWVVCCACLNLLDDQILQAAERKNGPVGPASTSASTASPASTAGPGPSSASGSSGSRPVLAPLQRPGPGMSGPAQIRSATTTGPHGSFARGTPGPGQGSSSGAGIASTGRGPSPAGPGALGGSAPGMRQGHPAENLSQTYRQMRGPPPQQQQQQAARSYTQPAPNGHGYAQSSPHAPQQQYAQQQQQQQQQRGMPPQSHSAPQQNGYDPRRGPPRAPPAGAGRRF